MKRLAVVVLAIPILLTGVAYCASGLKFNIPADWIDLSPNAPAENFTKVPPLIAKDARDPKNVAFATYDPPGPRKTRAVMKAWSVASRSTITEQSVKRLADHMEATETSIRDGGKFTLVSSGLITVEGTACGKIVGDLTIDRDGAMLTQALYLVPDGTQMVNVLFTTSSRSFKRLEPKFDEIILGVSGVSVSVVTADQASAPFVPVRADVALGTPLLMFEGADAPLPEPALTTAPAPARGQAAPALLTPAH
jgi:hypothetical protein